MTSKNAVQNNEIDVIEAGLDFEEWEGLLSEQLEESFSDLYLLEEDRATISNPDSLGKVVLEEVWKQFGNQIGLDMTDETLIQKYDREHPEAYKDIAGSVLQDQKYKNANNAMKEQQKAGNLRDEYTGKKLTQNDKANLEHVVSRKEVYENQRRKQAGLSVSETANKEENLIATNESLNKSKGAKSVNEYQANSEQRKKELIKQNERANKKIDESNMSAAEKRAKKEKNDKRLNDKLAANDELMNQADQTARKAINRDIQVNAAKNIGKKAGKDALKTMAVSSLFSLLKEVMNGLIRFLQGKAKSVNGFLSEMKKSIKNFFSKILGILQSGASAFLGTIVSEILGPIVNIFKKISSLIKQGISSIIDAIKYLRDEKNRNQPFAIKVAQIGKIVTVGLAAIGAIVLGEYFEKFLLTVPGMQTVIPLMGTLANMIGLFLSSLVSGLIGAIVLNFIDKFISKKLKEEKCKEINNKNTEIMNLQQLQIFVAENRVVESKENAMGEISENHALMEAEMMESLNKIFNFDNTNDSKSKKKDSKHQSDFDKMQRDLVSLL